MSLVRRCLITLASFAFLGTAVGTVAATGVQASPAYATESRFITTGLAQSPTNWQAFDGNDFAIYDVNHDGAPEIVISNDNLHHYVVDPRTGLVLAELSTTHESIYGGRELDAPAVGDVYNDGGTEIAIENGDAYLSFWKYNAQGSTATHFNISKSWEVWTNAKLWDPNFAKTHPYNANATPTSEGHPFLADVDGSGIRWVFSNAEDVSTAVAYTPAGAQKWFQDPASDLNAGVAVADLNNDGHRQAVFASDAGPVYVYDALTGAPMWTFDTRCVGGVYVGDGSNCNWNAPGAISVTPTIADLLGDGKKEICFGVRDVVAASDPGWTGTTAQIQANVDNSHAKLYCLTHDGHQLWMDQYTWFNPHVDMRPVPFDVNRDGVKDLLWIDWNTIGHKPGNWETTTRGPNLFALNGRNGTALWHEGLTEGWSNKGMALGDVLGDGRQLIVAEEYGPSGGDGVSVIDPYTGARINWVPLHAGYVASRGPVLGDLAGDGKLKIIVPLMRAAASTYCASHMPDVGCREGALDILDTQKPFSSVYTSSFNWSLSGSATPPPPPPPPPSGTFDATFTIKAPNEWWQELYVSTPQPHTIVKAQVRVNGGAWQPMSKSSWGAWTSSVHSVAGSQVEFLVTDSNNMVSQSLPFTWLDGTLTKGSTTPGGTTTPPPTTSTPLPPPTTSTTAPPPTTSALPPPTSSSASGFTASYKLGNVNEWWVEVYVAANAPLTSVEAKADGGAWTALTLQNWGAWAKSFHVVACTPVQFRATSTSGAQSLSGTYLWMDTGSCGTPSPTPTPTTTTTPPPTTFTASFAPQAVGNDWWVEVKVTANHPLAGVEAICNSGSTTTITALSATSWGTWAKSIHAPNGTVVQFRATDTNGASVTSGPVTWT